MSDTAPSAPIPYRRGWRAPWRRQWGPIADGHSRLGHLARRIEKDLLAEYDGARPLARDLIRRAARLMAMSSATLDMVGTDPRASRRAVSALAGAADRALDRLEKLGAKREAPVLTVHELMARHAHNGKGSP